jgi:hypothetical protein
VPTLRTHPAGSHHGEFLKTDYVEIGVRIGTQNRSLALQFKLEMDFWASLLPASPLKLP